MEFLMAFTVGTGAFLFVMGSFTGLYILAINARPADSTQLLPYFAKITHALAVCSFVMIMAMGLMTLPLLLR